ncbi:cytochrome P450 [Streptomyces sp. TLI_146]|uniref:cytochrome P450 n=1 Tax=Streptomyces sp. TLI_146 TaxID=1938858 RepID=UPI000CC5F740|nr:cytochrome P450 [Streptomyces sp. TLI_146]PKV83085.1 cytochrome P450 [Streptomyces sp. TLI_146]
MPSSTGAREEQPAPERGSMASWRRDPLAYLGAEFDGTRDVWRSATGRLCVVGPEAARDVMGNRQGMYVETSDFFHTRTGVFGPRGAQVDIGRGARALMRRRLDAARTELPHLVRDRLAPVSRWPDAGNLLVREHLADVLLCREAPAPLRQAVDDVVDRAVLAGARGRHSAVSRLVFRRRVMRVLALEIRARRAARAGDPRDLLDVVVSGGGPSAPPGDLAEVYLSFLFATVGSVGFALGWAVYLVGMHPGTESAEPEWIVREAMRLWPVAWLFTRKASDAHDLAGVAASPHDDVDVCSYLMHRHPLYWERPDEFVPRRWAAPPRDPAFMPFGYGPHTCAGATVTMALLEDLVRVITRSWRLSVTAAGSGPHLGPALAPPRFTAQLSDRVDSPGGR